MTAVARLVLAALLVLALPAAAAAATPRIVVFDELPPDAVERLRAAGITRAALFPGADAAAVVGPARAYRRLARRRDVLAVYRERRFALHTFQSKPTLGVDQVQASGVTGRGVTVAVFDTGIEDAHPDLDDRVAANAYFELSGVLDPITDGEYSRANAETPAGFDELQHGTLVAGIVAGTGDSAKGADLRGMAPEATLVNLKLIGEATHEFPDDLISETNALAAYQWLLDHRSDPRFPGGIRVATNSWGWDGPSFSPDAFTAMLRTVVDAGVVTVFAAGNAGPGPDTVAFPGRLPWIITVGANCKSQGVWSQLCPDGAGQVAEFSSRGEAVDVVAPGVDVWGAAAKLGFENTAFTPVGLLTSPGSAPPPAPGEGDPANELNNRALYLYGPGTSFATPHVAGIVALMLQANPGLTQEQVQRILQETATDLGPAGFDPDTGHGQVNALAAVQRAQALTSARATPPPAAPARAPTPRCVPGRTRVRLRAPVVSVRCSGPATVRVELRAGRDARRLGLPRVLARGHATVTGAGRVRLVVARSARTRARRLRAAQLRRLDARVTVRPAGGPPAGRRVSLAR